MLLLLPLRLNYSTTQPNHPPPPCNHATMRTKVFQMRTISCKDLAAWRYLAFFHPQLPLILRCSLLLFPTDLVWPSGCAVPTNPTPPSGRCVSVARVGRSAAHVTK